MSLRLNMIEAAGPGEAEMINWWANQWDCSIHQFQKTQFDPRSKYSQITDDYHSVGSITYNDTYLYERLAGVYSTYFNKKLRK